MSMGLGLALALPMTQPASAAAGPVSSVVSLEFLSDAEALDQTNDYGDATVRVGIKGTGFAKIIMPYLVGQTFDPTKLTVVTDEPGYDTSGNSVRRSRTIVGGAILRRQYSAVTANTSLKQVSNDGVNITVFFSLSERVYQGTNITSATVASGYYGSAQAGSISTILQNATYRYKKPNWAWAIADYESMGSGGLHVEGVAKGVFGMNGQQVACVQYVPKDSSGNTGTTVTVSSTALSTIQTQGNICETWQATIPTTNLAQGDLCFLNAIVYPWIGDSNAILNLSNDGVATTGDRSNACPITPLRFCCDKNGTYGGAWAAVKVGAVGGTVQTSEALAVTTPYPTWNAALVALAAYNSANKIGNTTHCGSTIVLMDNNGANVTHVASARTDTVSGAGKTWTTIKQYSGNTATATLETNLSTVPHSDLLKYSCPVTYDQGAFFNSGTASGNKRICAKDMTITTGGSVSLAPMYQFGCAYFINVNWNSNVNMLKTFSTTRMQPVLLMGVVSNNTTSWTSCALWNCLGCVFPGAAIADNASASNDAQDGQFMYNNKFMAIQSAPLLGDAQNFTTYGIVDLQNVWERAIAASSVQGVTYSQNDAQMVVFMEYTNFVGQDTGARTPWLYCQHDGNQHLVKDMFCRYTATYQYGSKGDTFITNSTQTGRVGNFQLLYTVDYIGVCAIDGDATGDTVPDNTVNTATNFLGCYWGPTNVPFVNPANVTYTNNQSGTSGAGNGNYSLTGSSNGLYNRVPAGMAGLKYDIAGVARKNDGTGAAGPYERTV